MGDRLHEEAHQSQPFKRSATRSQLNKEAAANLLGEGSSFCLGSSKDAFESAQELPVEPCAVSAVG